MYTGDADDVATQQRKIIDIAAQFSGFAAGSTNGQRGYLLTYIIAYVRVSKDQKIEHYLISTYYNYHCG
jgi:hypothetical protein